MRKFSLGASDVAAAARSANYPLNVADSPGAIAPARYWTDPDLNPFASPSQAHVMWLGSPQALAHLGVERGAEVRAEELARALLGRHAQTGERVRRPGTVEVPVLDAQGKPVLGEQGQPVTERVKRVASVDLTFSAPKSVSVLWSQAGPEQRAEIERAMMVAASAVGEYMTETKPVVHRRVDGVLVREPARGAAFSAALNVTARRAEGEEVPSPQLHVHLTLVGVESAAGDFVTPDSSALFKHGAPLEGGAVGRLALAHELVQLGYEVETDTGRLNRFFEVRGVPKGLIERMSGRTREVERAIAAVTARRGEAPRGGALAVIASETRAPKDPDLSGAKVARVWGAQGEEFDLGPPQVSSLKTHRGYEGSREERVAAAREEIARRFRTQGPTVSAGEARAIVYSVAQGRLSPEEARPLCEQLEREGELVALADAQVTTREIRATEQRVMEVAVAAARRNGPALAAAARAAGLAAANERLGEGKALDEEQVEAFELFTGGAGWTVLTGRAGTGKGPTLDAVAAAHKADGWKVLASAVDGTTVVALGEQVGEQVGERALTLEQVRYRVEHGALTLDDRTLLVIEEASKVGLRLWADVAEWCDHYGVRVLAVGHEGQHGAIELPGIFSELLRAPGMPWVYLQEIRRHRDPSDRSKPHPWLAEYQTTLDQGRVFDAVDILDREGAITLYDTREQAMAGMVDAWDGWRRTYAPEESMLIVGSSNADVDSVNVLAQARRWAAGELEGEGVDAVDREYRIHVGDVVILRNGSYRFSDPGVPRVENGQRGIVTHVDAERDAMEVALREPGREPRRVEIDLGRLRLERELARAGDRVPALRLAYAHHSFPVQGATVRGVESLDGHAHQRREGAYVAHTRPTDRLGVHLAHEDLGEGTREERLERFAARLGQLQARRSSIHWELDPGARIALAAPVPRAVPQLPARAREEAPEPQVPAADGAAALRARHEVRAPDPLARHRAVLGERRARVLAARAAELEEETAELRDQRLRGLRDELAPAFERLDRAAAREALRLERDRAIVEERPPEERGRYELERLERIDAAERRLRGEGRHPDVWLERDGEDAARWIAAERELGIRHELSRAGEVEQAQPAERAVEEALERADDGPDLGI